MPSVVLLQPDVRVADRLRALIEGAPEFKVVASVRNLAQVREAIDRLLPDVVVTDLQLPEGLVSDSMPSFRGARVVVIALSADDPRLLDALYAGVDGFFSPGRPLSLLAAIDQVLHGEATMTPLIARKVRQHFDMKAWGDTDFAGESQNPLRLSETERQLLRWTCEGFLPGEIARGLHQTVHGVGVRVRTIYRKLQFDVKSDALSMEV